MSRGEGPFIHLQLVEDFYRTFEVEPVPMPIRLGTMEEFTEGRLELSMEVLVTELRAYLEAYPAEQPRYRALFGELAMSVGTEAGKAGNAVKASEWLLLASKALPEDPRVLLNYAVSLMESGRPAEALEVCARVRALPRELREAQFLLLSLEADCSRAVEEQSRPVT